MVGHPEDSKNENGTCSGFPAINPQLAEIFFEIADESRQSTFKLTVQSSGPQRNGIVAGFIHAG